MKFRVTPARLTAAVIATASITLGLSGTPAYASGAPGEIKIGGYCLDAQNSGPYDGAAVQLYPCNGTGAQYWYERVYTSGMNTKVQLVNKASGRCLDIPNNRAHNGAQLQVWTCNQSDAQRFRFERFNPSGGWTTLVNDTSGLVVDAPGRIWHTGGRPYLHERNGTAAQNWYFTPGSEYHGGGGGCSDLPDGLGRGPKRGCAEL
ncbi:RICIN domain-containing protein [Streptomyces clavuligerus]|uniref:RICIN domain-containing protein n=1 Tax=Streptomyces clavuligerus TaxID=1901 RepID=UPI0001851E18|nr:RICIN domain-containing protein [Streptomyces clavuligerus]